MPNQHTSPASSNGANRERIVDAALQAFWEKGYHSTSTREIAKAVGLSPAAVYVHFPSKAKLLAEIVQDAHVRLVERLDAIVESVESPRQRLCDLVGTFSAFNAEHARIALVSEREMNALEPDAYERVRRQRDHIVRLLRDTLTQGIESGAFGIADTEVHDLVLGMVAISKDLSRWYQPNGPLTPAELGTLHGRWALRLVRDRDTERGTSER